MHDTFMQMQLLSCIINILHLSRGSGSIVKLCENYEMLFMVYAPDFESRGPGFDYMYTE